MNFAQKMIAIAALTFNAMFFHVLFCNWDRNYVGSQFDSINRRQIVSTGLRFKGTDTEYSWGINARSGDTYTMDAILGIALPVTLCAIAIFVANATSNHNAHMFDRDPPSAI